MVGAAGCRRGRFEGHQGVAAGGLRVEDEGAVDPAGPDEVPGDQQGVELRVASGKNAYLFDGRRTEKRSDRECSGERSAAGKDDDAAAGTFAVRGNRSGDLVTHIRRAGVEVINDEAETLSIPLVAGGFEKGSEEVTGVEASALDRHCDVAKLLQPGPVGCHRDGGPSSSGQSRRQVLGQLVGVTFAFREEVKTGNQGDSGCPLGYQPWRGLGHFLGSTHIGLV